MDGFLCVHCSEAVFSTEEESQRHLNEGSTEFQQGSAKQGMQKCPYCKAMFEEEADMVEHMRTCPKLQELNAASTLGPVDNTNHGMNDMYRNICGSPPKDKDASEQVSVYIHVAISFFIPLSIIPSSLSVSQIQDGGQNIIAAASSVAKGNKDGQVRAVCIYIIPQYQYHWHVYMCNHIVTLLHLLPSQSKKEETAPKKSAASKDAEKVRVRVL